MSELIELVLIISKLSFLVQILYAITHVPYSRTDRQNNLINATYNIIILTAKLVNYVVEKFNCKYDYDYVLINIRSRNDSLYVLIVSSYTVITVVV